MSIILGDVHGDVDRVKRFLAHRPEVPHYCTGDILDDFNNRWTEQFECLQMLVNSNCKTVWGNHDLHYLDSNIRLRSSGYQISAAETFGRYLMEHRGVFKASYAVDGYLLTHGGLVAEILPVYGVECEVDALSEWLNKEFETHILAGCNSSIFNVSFSRGGQDKHPGIFWCDFLADSPLLDVPQIVGHTERSGGVIKQTDSRKYKKYRKAFQINCDTRDFYCFDTETGKFEEI